MSTFCILLTDIDYVQLIKHQITDIKTHVHYPALVYDFEII